MNSTPLDDSLQAQLDRLAERVNRLEAHSHRYGGTHATEGPTYPTPPPAPAPDEAAIGDIAVILAREFTDGLLYGDDPGLDEHLENVARKIIALGLAAPADRVVVKPDIEDMAETICEWRDVLGSEGLARKIIERHWSAGADTPGEE